MFCETPTNVRDTTDIRDASPDLLSQLVNAAMEIRCSQRNIQDDDLILTNVTNDAIAIRQHVLSINHTRTFPTRRVMFSRNMQHHEHTRTVSNEAVAIRQHLHTSEHARNVPDGNEIMRNVTEDTTREGVLNNGHDRNPQQNEHIRRRVHNEAVAVRRHLHNSEHARDLHDDYVMMANVINETAAIRRHLHTDAHARKRPRPSALSEPPQ